MKRIILNADDFGKSPERNRAIDDSFKRGLISSAGLIVTGKHLEDAVDHIRKGGYFDKIHLHLNLSTNLMREDSEDIPLTEEARKDPFFSKDSKFKPYKGLPGRFSSIIKWRIAYKEIVAQYNKFMAVTEGEADYKHIDFHLWFNLTWPVSVALRCFIKRYKIKTVRYIGMHQMHNRRYSLFRAISRTSDAKYIPATNIDYYLSNRKLFSKLPIVELYCHPNYKDGILLDDSPSYLKHDRQPLLKHVQLLKETGSIEYVSWSDVE